MSSFLPTIILRHRKENIKKCSLQGLETREDLHFISYPFKQLPDISSYVVLTLDGPPLKKQDQNKGLFFIDATWKYSEVMLRQLPKDVETRTLPEGFRTAYPRKQPDCADPSRGLATVEALYIAYCILGRDVKDLLDHYYWKDRFFILNE